MAADQHRERAGGWPTQGPQGAGLTQADLALAAGVGLRFVVDLEAGKPTVQLELVLRVIEALGGSLQLHDLPSEAKA